MLWSAVQSEIKRIKYAVVQYKSQGNPYVIECIIMALRRIPSYLAHYRDVEGICK
jgi:hypothetical protein